MTKHLLKNKGIITFCICLLLKVQAQTVIYTTDFGTTPNVNPTGWTFTGVNMNISTITPLSSGYTGVSGGAYLGEGSSGSFTNTSGAVIAASQIGNSSATLQMSTLTYSNIVVSFGMRKSSAGYNTNATYTFEWSTDNISYTAINYTEATAGSWGLATGAALALPAGANNQTNLYLRYTFNRTGTSSNYKIDDIKVTSTPPTDVTPPTVISAYLSNSSTVKVKFSEAVTVSSATTATNYTFTPLATIGSITLNTIGDTATLNLSSPAPAGIYTLTINGIKDLALNTMTVSQNFTLSSTGIIAKSYTWKHPQTIGTYQGLNIPNGGFSGLNYIKGTTNEFYVITDRGANLDANNNNHAIAIGGVNNTGKLFALPAFSPNVMRFKAQGDSLVYISSFTVKRPDNSSTTGLINPAQTGGTGEIALVDTNGTLGTPDVWGIDSEGLTDGNNNDFWMSEEYGTSIWHTDVNGKVINRYAPYGGLPGSQPQDLPIDTIFKFRNPNKGFEGIAFAPNKKVYGFLQNTLLFPTSDVNLKKNTRLHRFVEIDTRNNTTRMLGYEHDAVPASGPMSSIKSDKRYIGDAVAVNDHEVLILEHGKSSTESYGKVYLVDISPATPINPTNHLAYAGGTKSFEQLLDSTTAATNGVTVVKKTLLIDLIANGYDPSIEKEEGITIVNDTCIAIANDNDFGVISNNADGVASYNNVKSYIYIFSFPRSRQLNLCANTTITSTTLSACSGDSIQLTAPSTTGINYQWKNTGTPLTGATASSYYAKANGSYELYATNANGCISISNTKLLSFAPSPTVTVSSNTTTVCAGQSVTLTANGATNYTWSPTGALTNTITVTPFANTTYSVTGTNSVCAGKSNLSITVNALPSVSASVSNTLICAGQTTSLTAGGAASYTWNPGNLTGSTVTITPAATTVYTVTGQNTNGCSNKTNITQSVSTCTGIENLTGNESGFVTVFPNPNTGTFTVKSNSDLTINVINQLGQVLRSITLNTSTNYTADISGMPVGIYYLMNTSTTQLIHQKIIVTQ